MPLDHYLPAAHLAAFSNESTLPRRERHLVAGDLIEHHLVHGTAAGFCAEHDFYTLTDHPSRPRLLDEIFSSYEHDLPSAIDALLDGSIDARTWARVLVPFVAGLLVRGPDFNTRFSHRLLALGLDSSPGNTNRARLFELQRLLAPVLAAEWIVLHATGPDPIIQSDVGYVGFTNVNLGHLGIAFPLRLDRVLVLVPRRAAPIVIESEGRWVPLVSHSHLAPGNHLGLNRTLASSAHRFVFGPDEKAIIPHLSRQATPSRVPESEELGFITGTLSVVHEFAWHRLVGVLEKSPFDPDTWDFSLDWHAIAAGWAPLVILPTNLPEFPAPLSRSGPVISIQLYDIPGFTS
jgi:hypothetical protein